MAAPIPMRFVAPATAASMTGALLRKRSLLIQN
jgi:hypothetical protein